MPGPLKQSSHFRWFNYVNLLIHHYPSVSVILMVPKTVKVFVTPPDPGTQMVLSSGTETVWESVTVWEKLWVWGQ